MNHHDEEITDVIVVLDEKGATAMANVCQALKDAGLSIDEVKDQEGVVEGSICSDKLSKLKLCSGVAYVRSVFTYTADYPVGDPRDLDGVEEPLEDDED
jgi:hypothetical protein